MKPILFAAVLAVLLGHGELAWAQSAAAFVREADQHYAAGDYGPSSYAYDAAIAAGAKNPTTFFNAACSAALAGRIDTAFTHLDGALERGFHDLELLNQDTDLTALREDARWARLLVQANLAQEKFLASIGDVELRSELLEMARVDQAARRGEAIPELEGRDMNEVDAQHTARMKEIVAQFGWPTQSLVGEDGARSAWLLVQHADLQPGFQRECLDLMTAAEPGEVDATDVAYLTDRVLVNEGKLQIYGTQFWTQDGELQPRPMEDPTNVEDRRAEVGLGTFADYYKLMTGQVWTQD